MSTPLRHEMADGSTVAVQSGSDDQLGLLAALDASTRQIASWRLQVVTRARRAGHSWAEIGAAMGMSKQAAWEQFSDDVGRMLGQVRTDAEMGDDEAMELTVDEVQAMRAAPSK
jgi:hypothetical protein